MACALFNDPQGDTIAGNPIALFKSFAYMADGSRREGMLIAAEEALMPYISAVSDAVNKLSIQAHQHLTREESL